MDFVIKSRDEGIIPFVLNQDQQELEIYLNNYNKLLYSKCRRNGTSSFMSKYVIDQVLKEGKKVCMFTKKATDLHTFKRFLHQLSADENVILSNNMATPFYSIIKKRSHFKKLSSSLIENLVSYIKEYDIVIFKDLQYQNERIKDIVISTISGDRGGTRYVITSGGFDYKDQHDPLFELTQNPRGLNFTTLIHSASHTSEQRVKFVRDIGLDSYNREFLCLDRVIG